MIFRCRFLFLGCVGVKLSLTIVWVLGCEDVCVGGDLFELGVMERNIFFVSFFFIRRNVLFLF